MVVITPELSVERVRQLIVRRGILLKYASEECKDDTEIAYKAVKNEPEAFAYVSKRLKDDENLIRLAVYNLRNKTNFANFTCGAVENLYNILIGQASDRIINNKKFILELISKYSFIVIALPIFHRCRNDRTEEENETEILYVTTAIGKSENPKNIYYPGAYRLLSEKNKKCRNLALKLVRQNRGVYRFLNQEFKEDPEFILNSIGPNYIGCLSDWNWNRNCNANNFEIYKNKKFIKQLLDKNFSIVSKNIHIFNQIKNDKEIVLKVISKYGHLYEYLDEDMRNDVDIKHLAIISDADNINHCNLSLKDLPINILKKVLKKNGMVLEYLCESMRSNYELIEIACASNYLAYNYAIFKNGFQTKIYDIAKKNFLKFYSKIKNNDQLLLHNLRHIPKCFLKDKELMIKLLSYHGVFYCIINDSLKSEQDIIKVTLNQNPLLLDIIKNKCDIDKEVLIKTERKILFLLTKRNFHNNFIQTINKIQLFVREIYNKLINIKEYYINDIDYALSCILFSNENLKIIDPKLKENKIIQDFLKFKKDRNNVQILRYIVQFGIKITPNFEQMVLNYKKPILAQDLGGNIYPIYDWLHSNNIKNKAQEMYPELGDFELYYEDILITNDNILEIKKNLLETENSLELMIVYLE